MIVFDNGNYETGDWLTDETYPNRIAYVVEEGSELAAKISSLYPLYTLNIVDGVLVDVTPREKTQAEIDEENNKPPTLEEEVNNLKQLVADLASLQLGV